MGKKREVRGHVYYFEPNDTSIGVDQDGAEVPLMPHLEDMCISMSLTADISERKKSTIANLGGPKDHTVVTKSINWVSYINQDDGITVKRNYQIGASGTEIGGEKFLTTYYTEISADKYIENELIEGLGITSVNVSFESWYTPTITINFVDVHGSSLWGREEAIHDNGEINASNILGVFFMQPYPLFRLQIKGFLGQAVTYQLTVSSFNGKYNSQTGNFEATATFIGYSYSLLTDIPLNLLSVIAEDEYCGKKYWDEHKNSDAWQMHNPDKSTCPPIPLYQLIENIKSAVGTIEQIETKDCDGTPQNKTKSSENGGVENPVEKDQKVALNAAVTVTNATNKNTELKTLKQSVDDLINAFKEYCIIKHNGSVYVGEKGVANDNTKMGETQLVFHFADRGGSDIIKTLDVSNDIKHLKESVNTAFEKYNASNPQRQIDNPFKNGDDLFKAYKLFYVIQKNGSTQVIYSEDSDRAEAKRRMERDREAMKKPFIPYAPSEPPINSYETQQESQKSLNRNKLFPNVKNQLEGQMTLINNGVLSNEMINNFGEYVTIWNLGTLYSILKDREREINDAAQNIENNAEDKTTEQSNSAQKVNGRKKSEEEIERERIRKIVDIIGFEPTIGNFVKLVMCHLETFCEVMFTCGQRILDQQKIGNRYPKYLGLGGLEDTDIPSNNTSSRTTSDNADITPIYPWPALYNPKYDANNSETVSDAKDSKKNVLGWPADYPTELGGKWEEKEVVLSFLKAIARFDAKTNGKAKDMRTNMFHALPMSGLDLSKLTSPFNSVGNTCDNIETLAAYLGLRIAQLIGIGDCDCDDTIAEAIGSVDAINLIQAYPSAEFLKRGVKVQGESNNFIKCAVDLLTISNVIDGQTETESGAKYNVFETAHDGTYYHKTRHPMYMKDGDSSMKYTYAYMQSKRNPNEIVSIVPTDLRPFSEKENPYASLLNPSSNNGVLMYKPQISKGDNQWWIYGGSTHNVVDTSSSENKDFINNQLFNVITSSRIVNSLTSEIELLLKGELKVKNYSVGIDDKIKNFVERRYKTQTEDYSKFYFDTNGKKQYHMIAPSMKEINDDYVKNHLCLTNEEKSKVTFNDEWCNDVTSDVFKSLSLQKGKEGISFKSGDKTYASDEVDIINLPIMVNGDTLGSLFGSQLYYAQNDIEDEKRRRLSKAYLLLSSMMTGVDIEKSLFKVDDKNSTSIIRTMPPFYVYFIGALLWRNSVPVSESVNFDFIDEKARPNNNSTIISKSEKIVYVDTQTPCEWYILEDYYDKYELIDPVVKNKLIKMFVSFAYSDMFNTIVNNCELTDFKYKSLIYSKSWPKLVDEWSNESTFKKENPEDWAKVFGEIFTHYSSIVPSQSNLVLNLMFNEKNPAIGALYDLYGLQTPFLVGRSTSKRVGRGKNEIKVSQSQMNAYLKGFSERINSYEESEVSEEIRTLASIGDTVDRDVAINTYYSLKHLWDTWLITSARDQFTIENFFNKYFVFMDSFYVNTYNKIKINPEHILKAYHKESQSMFTFITDVTSLAHCMFFALPDFVDSNIYSDPTLRGYGSEDFSWRIKDLDNIFTPVPYSEKKAAQPNNVFVFIYTHPFSDNALENTGKRFDSYMITDYNTWPDQLKGDCISGSLKEGADRKFDDNDKTPSVTPSNTLDEYSEELVSGRYGYMMPCFGVAVNRANNVIFKSINVNMNSYKITSVAATTWENILSKTGADGSKRIYFKGQDIYSIYSQYSYMCEIEMMGCAQIQPLMYFQLLNIPMWRGTYMIYKVTHSMTPGNMSTKFVGMKMSRLSTPYASGYYSIGKTASQKASSIEQQTDAVQQSEDAAVIETHGTYAVGGDNMIQAIFGSYTGYRVSAAGSAGSFGYPRKNSSGVFNHHHAGVDISAPEGTALYAPWDGKITRAQNTWDGNPKNAAGKHLTFQDSTGKNQVKYLHCSEIIGVKGNSYKKGELIAKVGHTGGNAATKTSCKPHLHLELYINGQFGWGKQLRKNGGTLDAVDPTIEHGSVGS